MQRCVCVLATAVLLSCCAGVSAEPSSRPGVTPIEAELVSEVQAHLAHVGEKVFARVTADWQSADCILRDGAILEAHVVSVVPHTRAVKSSELSLAFTKAQCGAIQMSPFEMLLAGLVSPPRDNDLGIISAPVPLSTGGATGIDNLKAMQLSNSFNIRLNMPAVEQTYIPRMRMGEVSGFRDVKLSVGTGPENSSVLTSAGHDILLEKHTVLLLVPLVGTFPHAEAAVAAASGPTYSVSAFPVQPPANDLDLCAPPECSLALPDSNVRDNGKPLESVSILQLGYSPRPRQMHSSFDNDEVLAYLGPGELLVAFNPHELTTRHLLGPSGATERIIRAVIFDTSARKVTHRVDWELPDDGPFLWPIFKDRILVHVASELRVYGAGLRILNRIPLDGPLDFVRVTPDGNFLAVGVLHERHASELHRQLTEELGAQPEEDVEIRVYNSRFEPIASSVTHSRLVAPTLLNEGQATLLAQSNMRYRIFLQGWDNKSSTLARFNSSCTPEISAITSGLLFMVSCDKQNDEVEYRVLRSDGKLALKGISDPYQYGYEVQGSANQRAFVVKSIVSTRPASAGSAFSAADFASEELRVYRAGDSKRLLSISVTSPSSSRDGFALSPDGSELAVLTRDQVAVYAVPTQ